MALEDDLLAAGYVKRVWWQVRGPVTQEQRGGVYSMSQDGPEEAEAIVVANAQYSEVPLSALSVEKVTDWILAEHVRDVIAPE